MLHACIPFFHPGVNVLLTQKENVSLVVDIFVAKFNSEYAVKETLQADGDINIC